MQAKKVPLRLSSCSTLEICFITNKHTNIICSEYGILDVYMLPEHTHF